MRLFIRFSVPPGSGAEYVGKTTSWIIYTRGLWPIWWSIGYVNAKSVSQAIEKARAKWPGRRHLAPCLKASY